MNKISTQPFTSSTTQKESRTAAPSGRTLAFIRQFARAYHVEKVLSAPFNGLVLN